jgi:hypothetical protein
MLTHSAEKLVEAIKSRKWTSEAVVSAFVS